jgi:Cu2+-exporting ATPase
VLLAAVAAGAWWWASGPAHAIGVAVAVLIVTCPCALSLATPAATLAAAGALAREGVLVRNLAALESGAAADTVVFDKTGTLTGEQIAARVSAVRTGVDAPTVLMLAGALARQSLHPVSRAITLAAGACGERRITPSQLVEHPGCGIQALVQLHKGDPQVMRLGSAKFCGAAATEAQSEVFLSDAAGWLATFSLGETLRPDAAGAVQDLKAMGLDIQLLSGDQPQAVTRLARWADIDQAFAACSPEDKLNHLRRLQQAGRTVVMVGDGLNDGPVLACADMSIAMGSAVPLAQARSDFIVQGGQLAAVPALLSLARRTRRIVRQNLVWAALYNAVCVPLAIAGAMPPWLAGLGMAASSLLVVANSARLSRMPSTAA